MLSGFDFCAPLTGDVNPHNLDQNCYFCTVSALMNMDVNNLVAVTETMQQNTANRSEIERLFRDAGRIAKPYILKGFNITQAGPDDLCDWNQALAVINSSINGGQYCGVDFVRPDGTGHMVVAYRESLPFPHTVYADFQVPPAQRQVLNWPPENGYNYGYGIWLVDVIDELTAKFPALSLN